MFVKKRMMHNDPSSLTFFLEVRGEENQPYKELKPATKEGETETHECVD